MPSSVSLREGVFGEERSLKPFLSCRQTGTWKNTENI